MNPRIKPGNIFNSILFKIHYKIWELHHISFKSKASLFSFIIWIKSCHLTNDELFQPLHSHAPSQNPSDSREARIIPVSTKSCHVYSQIFITCINVVYKARGSWASLLTLTFQAIKSMKKTLSYKHLGSDFFQKITLRQIW